MTIDGFIFSILCSIIASFMFWILTFRISETKVKFAEHIEKSPDIYGVPNRYRYRIKLINIGRRDLLEVTCIVRLIVKGKYTNNNSYIKLGNYDVISVLLGKKWQNRNPKGKCAWILPIQMTNTAYRDFTKEFYPEQIKASARQQKLTVGDILEEFNSNATIVIYVFGYDAVTGARRMFQSKSYSYTDIIEGRYKGAKQFKRYDDYVKNMLEISPHQFNLQSNQDTDIKKDTDGVESGSIKSKKGFLYSTKHRKSYLKVRKVGLRSMSKKGFSTKNEIESGDHIRK